MTSCQSILLLLSFRFYASYCSNTTQPSAIPTVADTLNVTDFLYLYGECNNPSEAKYRYDYLTLSACIDICKEDGCMMLQYYDKLLSDYDSRCYIFDKMCKIVRKRTNFSYIYYKNQFTRNYCVDYKGWQDKYMDSCDSYVSHGLCLNGTMTDKATLVRFEQARDPIYNWNALEVCCECGGGHYVYDHVSVTYVNKNDFNDTLKECSFKNDMTSTSRSEKWNNFGLHQLMEEVNYPSNSDVFIYKHLLNLENSTILYTISICDFTPYDITTTSNDIYIDFFIFASVEYTEEEEYIYFLNSEYFEIDLSVMSTVLDVEYYSYQLCNSLIFNASLDDNTEVDMMLPCFENITSTELNTETPEIEIVTETTVVTQLTVPENQTQDIKEEIVKTPEPDDCKILLVSCDWMYVIITCASLLSIGLICFFVVRKRQKKTQTEAQLRKHQTFSEDGQQHIQQPKDIFESDVKEGSRISDDQHSVDIIIEESDDTNKNIEKGLLVFQEAQYHQKQMKHIFDQHYAISSAQPPIMLFGDNDVDNQRKCNVERLHYSGQAEIMGPYDRDIAHGITTTFYKSKPDKYEFFRLMDEQFMFLQKQLLNGNDVVVPKPTRNDVLRAQNKYCINGKQKIFHNLGTGIAQLPFTHIQYIQDKIDELGTYARETKTVTYYSYSSEEKIISQRNGLEKYQCSWCKDTVHYVINFKHCKHDACEACLAGYIIEDLDYTNNSDVYKFKCWVSKTGKCPNGRLCLDDVKIPEDKCHCDECKQKNADTGNGTILDDESYKQFKHIMAAFGANSYDIEECANPKCKKPFQIDRPWRSKYDKFTNGYNHERKMSFFDDVVINPNECNCCGKRFSNDVPDTEVHDLNNVKDIGTIGFQIVNNCRICHQYYCDTCKSNCFYEIDTKFTVRPPTPVSKAMMIFHSEQKLKKVEVEQKSDIEREAFECCEVCWYRFYGRQCPHCNYRFCGICNGKWNQCTADWTDKIENFQRENDDEKYGLDNLYTYIDEKNGKHDSKAHHSCSTEKIKLEQNQMRMQQVRNERERDKYDNKLKLVANKLQEEQMRNIHKDETIKVLQKELEMIKTEKDTKIKVLENRVLKLVTKENEELEHKSDLLRHELVIKDKKLKDIRKQLFVISWKWKDHEKWTMYDEDMNKKIEVLKIGESLTFGINVSENNTSYKITRTSECKGTQTNTKTNFSREIQRFEVKDGYIEYPKFWNMKELQLGNVIKYAEPKLVQLNINKSPAKEVANQFYATSKQHRKYQYANIKIISIESVQNQRLYDKYWRERSVLMREIGQSKLNENYLWHGTGTVKTLDLIKKEGFRREFNKTAMWGQGVYFAVNSGYSVSYASNDNGIRKMFQCKVLCGESILGSGGYKLTSWPKKQNKLIYDSLHSKEKDIYVIHEDVRAYPMFVVTFKMN